MELKPPHPVTFKVQMNSDLPSTPTSPKRSAHFTFSDKKNTFLSDLALMLSSKPP